MTPKQFNLFRKTCNKYLKLYDLLDWKITYRKHMAGFSKNEGKVIYDASIKEATIMLYKWNDFTNGDIKEVAHHEVAHLFFVDLLEEVENALKGIKGAWKKFKIRKKEHQLIEKLWGVVNNARNN
jgi:hypothetical protein